MSLAYTHSDIGTCRVRTIGWRRVCREDGAISVVNAMCDIVDSHSRKLNFPSLSLQGSYVESGERRFGNCAIVLRRSIILTWFCIGVLLTHTEDS